MMGARTRTGLRSPDSSLRADLRTHETSSGTTARPIHVLREWAAEVQDARRTTPRGSVPGPGGGLADPNVAQGTAKGSSTTP